MASVLPIGCGVLGLGGVGGDGDTIHLAIDDDDDDDYQL